MVTEMYMVRGHFDGVIIHPDDNHEIGDTVRQFKFYGYSKYLGKITLHND